MNISNLKTLLATTAVAMTLAAGAQAAPIFLGDTQFSFTNTTGSVATPGFVGNFKAGGTITDATTPANPIEGSTSAGTGNFPVSTPMGSVLLQPITLTVGAAISFTISGVGSFMGTIDSLLGGGGANGTSAIGVLGSGTFTPTNPAFEPNTGTTINFSFQRAGANPVGSGSGSLDSPERITVPEPMSLALFGMGLAGLGMAIRRKA